MKPNAPFAAEPVIRDVPALRDRTMRRPKHSWQIGRRPYALCPIALAPVMAGDTLASASIQARALTAPLASPLRGWFAEMWWFFVRIIDMPNLGGGTPTGEEIMAVLIDETQSPPTTETVAADVYHGYGINWMQRCLDNIVPMYFRDRGETGLSANGLPLLQMRSHSWFENYIATSALPADDADAEDYENLWTKWSVLSRNRLTTATYEEFLRQNGVIPPARLREPDLDLKIPELLRYFRSFEYPVSTIDPTTGAASNAVSWAIQDRMERARRFTEPGFIVGLMAVRPKEYTPTAPGSGSTSIWQPGSAAGALNTAKSWIPPVYTDEPGESLRSFPAWSATNGPIGQKAATFAYHLDHRDLWLVGDQMVHGLIDPGLTVARRDFPDWKYPTVAGITALFAGGDGNSGFKAEGMVSLNIKGRVRRTTA